MVLVTIANVSSFIAIAVLAGKCAFLLPFGNLPSLKAQFLLPTRLILVLSKWLTDRNNAVTW